MSDHWALQADYIVRQYQVTGVGTLPITAPIINRFFTPRHALIGLSRAVGGDWIVTRVDILGTDDAGKFHEEKYSGANEGPKWLHDLIREAKDGV